MITLVPMTEAEFIPYCAALAAAYAQEQISAGVWDAESAAELSAQSIAQDLPDGLATPDNALYLVRDDEVPEAVGQLWVRIHRGLAPSIFIMDIEINAPYQRRGYAQQTLAALERQAKTLGIDKIRLHVHAQNRGAQALYEKMGFTVTGHSMLKRLNPESGEQ